MERCKGFVKRSFGVDVVSWVCELGSEGTKDIDMEARAEKALHGLQTVSLWKTMRHRQVEILEIETVEQ